MPEQGDVRFVDVASGANHTAELRDLPKRVRDAYKDEIAFNGGRDCILLEAIIMSDGTVILRYEQRSNVRDDSVLCSVYLSVRPTGGGGSSSIIDSTWEVA
jgi:hypothetical protein